MRKFIYLPAAIFSFIISCSFQSAHFALPVPIVISNSKEITDKDLDDEDTEQTIEKVDPYDQAMEKAKELKIQTDNTGWLYFEKKAIETYSYAITLKPKAWQPYWERAKLYEDFKEYDKAKGNYDKLIKMFPEWSDAYDRRVSVNQILNDTASVSKDLKKIKELIKKDLARYKKANNIRYPKTLKEAVDFLCTSLDEDTKQIIKETAKYKLIKFHFSLGMYIRNEFALWSGNTELLASCGSENMHPDDASMIIINELWNRLNGG